jgi:hypothetical protein
MVSKAVKLAPPTNIEGKDMLKCMIEWNSGRKLLSLMELKFDTLFYTLYHTHVHVPLRYDVIVSDV